MRRHSVPARRSCHAFVIVLAFFAPVVFLSPAGGQAGPNPAFTNIPDNTWVKLTPTVLNASGTDITSLGFPWYPFSGLVYSQQHNALIMWGAGGHGTWYANSVWLYDPAKNEWREQYQPDPLSNYPFETMTKNQYDADCADGKWGPSDQYVCGGTTTNKPWTTHSYDQMALDTVHGELLYHGFVLDDGSGGNFFFAQDLWGYTVTTKTWRHLNAGPGLSGASGSTEFDPVHNMYVMVTGVDVWQYNVVTGALVQKNTAPQQFLDTVMVYDTVNQRMLLYGSDYPAHGELWEYLPASDQWTHLQPTPDPAFGSPPATAPNAAFDSQNRVMLLWGKGDTGSFVPTWTYNVTTNAWRKMNPSGGDPPVVTEVATSNLAYDPIHNLFFLVVYNGGLGSISGHSGELGDLWVYRYANVPHDTTPPGPPTGLIVQ